MADATDRTTRFDLASSLATDTSGSQHSGGHDAWAGVMSRLARDCLGTRKELVAEHCPINLMGSSLALTDHARAAASSKSY